MDAETQAAIDRIPGASPWDWKTFPSIPGFAWFYDQKDGLPHGYVSLREAETSAYKLALGTHCHPFAIGPGKLGLWFEESGLARVVCFETAELPDLPRPARFTKLGMHFHAGTNPQASLLIPPNLSPDGIHKLDVPKCFDAVTELLMAVRYGEGKVTTILSLRPSAGELRLYPQLWFEEMFAGGWEWIKRVTRHPIRGTIIGSGERIRAFELTEDALNLGHWL